MSEAQGRVFHFPALGVTSLTSTPSGYPPGRLMLCLAFSTVTVRELVKLTVELFPIDCFGAKKNPYRLRTCHTISFLYFCLKSRSSFSLRKNVHGYFILQPFIKVQKLVFLKLIYSFKIHAYMLFRWYSAPHPFMLGPLTRSSQVSMPLACLFVLTRKTTKVHFKTTPNSLGAEGIDVKHGAEESLPSSVPPC